MSQLTWSPLESNPEVMTRFLKHLGVSKKWKFVDILSLDPDYLNFLPKPVIAILFLFPISGEQENKQYDKLFEDNPNVYFMHQCSFNACGTVALIHAIANNLDYLKLESDSVINKFLEETKLLSPQKKSEALELNSAINAAHETTAWEVQKDRPSWLSDDVCCQSHYITLIEADSKLYELDGLKNKPICHGNTNAMFLEESIKICQEYIKRQPENIKFNAMALVKDSL